MSDDEVRALPSGVYMIWWANGEGWSVAAVGRNVAGAVWLAPSNWLSGAPTYTQWFYVEKAKLLCLCDHSSPDDLTGLLLAALRESADATGLRALQDCIGERIGPPALKHTLKALEWTQHRGSGHEDGEWWSASTVFGSMDVGHEIGTGCLWCYCFDEYYDEAVHHCASIEEGKREAEEYYRSRILPALEGVQQ